MGEDSRLCVGAVAATFAPGLPRRRCDIERAGNLRVANMARALKRRGRLCVLAMLPAAIIVFEGCGHVARDSEGAGDAGPDAAHDAYVEPSPCQALGTKEACCASECYWLKGQDGFPSRCLHNDEICDGYPGECPAGLKCYIREYGCARATCEYDYNYCSRGIGICVAECPGGSEALTNELGQPICWGGKGG